MGAGTAALALAAFVYLYGTFRFQREIFGGAGAWERWRPVLWTGLGLHTLGLFLLSAALGHPPITGLAEATGTLAWMLVLLHVVIAPRWNVEALGVVATPVAFTLTAFCLVALRTESGAPVQSSWTVLHVASVVLGYGAFTFAAICAGLYVVQSRMLKQKNLTGLFRRLPPLHTLDQLAYRLILLGFLPMVLGIATGMLMMHADSGVWWRWEPKLTLVALTGFVYLIYLHARLLAGWQGRRVNILLLVAFFFVLVSYLAPGEFHRF